MQKRFISVYDVQSLVIFECEKECFKQCFKRVNITTINNGKFLDVEIPSVLANQLGMVASPDYAKFDKIDVGAKLLHDNKIDIDTGSIVFVYELKKNVEKEFVQKIANKARKICQTIYYPPEDGCSSGIKSGMNMEALYEFDNACDKFIDSLE